MSIKINYGYFASCPKGNKPINKQTNKKKNPVNKIRRQL